MKTNSRARNARDGRNRARRNRWAKQGRACEILALLLLAVLVLLIVCVVRKYGMSAPSGAVRAFAHTGTSDRRPLALPSQASEPSAAPAQVSAAEPAAPMQVPTAEPARQPISSEYGANAAYRPEARAGHLPVFVKSGTDEKIIAITVDDCYQAANLTAIVQSALDCGGKLTLFPIGENALRAEQSKTLRYAWQSGFELENHTMTHNGLYAVSDEDLAREVYGQNLALDKVLGVEYREHFLRPYGGDASYDQRMHAYARQLGYYGIAYWTYCGGVRDVSMEDLKQSLAPGMIYLFHTTDTDRERLVEFMPYAVAQGYHLVTLNEMFGYPENETAPLTEPVEGRAIPALEPYDPLPETYKKTTYAYGVYQMQRKLIDLGYLSGEEKAAADGVYGETCAEAVGRFQGDHGLPVTGEADPETQARIDEAHGALEVSERQAVPAGTTGDQPAAQWR